MTRRVALAVSGWLVALVLLGVLASQADAHPGHDHTPATQPKATGTLVIAGGALDPEHEAVYRAVLDRIGPEGTLGVLPTASGVPEESGPLTVQDFQQYAGPDQKVVLIDIRHDTPAKANSPDYVLKITACDGLWFTGGDQSRITAVFRPNGVDTPAYLAVKTVLAAGGVVGGTSAGAAMMSDPMIRWGNSHEALLLGRSDVLEDWAVGVGQGMGFLPWGVTDQHFLARGRLGRMLTACATEGVPVGIGVEENCAAIVDLTSRTLTVVGGPGVLVTELQPRPNPGDPVIGNPLLDTPWKAWTVTPGESLTFSSDGRVKQSTALPPQTASLLKAASGAPRSYEGGAWFDVVEPAPGVFAFEPGDRYLALWTDAHQRFEAAKAEVEAERAAGQAPAAAPQSDDDHADHDRKPPPWGGLAYAEALLVKAAEAEHVSLTTFGQSVEGRDLWAVRISRTPEGDPLPVGHRKALLIGLQHGDEPAGGAALLELIVDASQRPASIPETLELWVVPVMNPDGAERDERRNANDFDLNRDHVILSQPETRAVHALARSVGPDVIVDCHEFNRTTGDYAERGWLEWPEITLGSCSHPMIPTPVREKGQQFVETGIAAEHGHAHDHSHADGEGGFHYARYLVGSAPTVPGGELRPSTLDADDARNGLSLATGGMGFIVESGIQRAADNPQADLARRVAAYRALLKTMLDTPVDPAVFEGNVDKLLSGSAAIPTDFFWARTEAQMTPVKVIEVSTGKTVEVASPTVMDTAVVKSAVPTPVGYAVSGDLPDALELTRALLEGHGLAYAVLEQPVEVDAERVELIRIDPEYDDQYHRYAGRQVTRRLPMEPAVLPVGSIVVRLDALGPVDARRAAAVLEPCMRYGLFQWPQWRATVGDDGVLPFIRLTTERGLPGLDAPGLNPYATPAEVSAAPDSSLLGMTGLLDSPAASSFVAGSPAVGEPSP
ncbi:MAG: cyanophycinase [Planctomycetota bacterium]